MQTSEKFRSDLGRWEAASAADRASMEELRAFFGRSLPGLPRELLGDAFQAFLERAGSPGQGDMSASLDWLAGVQSLLSGQYDGSPFSRADWKEIREMVSANAGEMDMDLLTDIMARVMEHGALD